MRNFIWFMFIYFTVGTLFNFWKTAKETEVENIIPLFVEGILATWAGIALFA